MQGLSIEQFSNIDGSEQFSLPNEAEHEYSASAVEPTVETVNVKSHPRRKRLSREGLPESVERKKVVIDLDDKKYPECGEEMVCIGEEFVRSELNNIPTQIFVIDYYRKKYKCKKCEEKGPEISIVNATRLGCWSHARRNWVECLPKGIEDKNSKAAQALELVEQVFAEEKSLEGLPKDEFTNSV